MQHLSATLMQQLTLSSYSHIRKRLQTLQKLNIYYKVLFSILL